MGVADLLQEGEKAEPTRRQLLMLQQQAKRAADIVQNLMYFSRPPAPGRVSVDLNELVQRTLHLHAYSLRKNNVTVHFVPERSLPSVTGDSHQLMQIFLNLIPHHTRRCTWWSRGPASVPRLLSGMPSM